MNTVNYNISEMRTGLQVAWDNCTSLFFRQRLSQVLIIEDNDKTVSDSRR